MTGRNTAVGCHLQCYDISKHHLNRLGAISMHFVAILSRMKDDEGMRIRTGFIGQRDLS